MKYTFSFLALTALTACSQRIIPWVATPFTLPGIEETSPLVINNQVVIMGSSRNADVVGDKLVFKALSGQLLAEVPTDIACASARVLPNGQIQVVGVRHAEAPGDSVVMLILDSQYKIISEKTVLNTGQWIYNTSLEGNILAYDVRGDESGHYRIYFADITTGLPVGKVFDNAGKYATTPTLRKIDDWYYIFFTALRKDGKKYQLYSAVARSQDLKHFSSTHRLIDIPGTYACDPDLVELEGKTYLSIGDGPQTDMASETGRVLVYNGTLKELLAKLF